jgi:hypothetical protein
MASGAGGSGSGEDEAFYDQLSDEQLKRCSYARYAARRKRRVEERDAARLTEDERMRRSKIGEANKGRVPWNKGRKHTPGAGARAACCNGVSALKLDCARGAVVQASELCSRHAVTLTAGRDTLSLLGTN